METPRPDRVKFASKLKSLRTFNDMMTQEGLARDSGVDVELIRNYEQGKSLDKTDAIVKPTEASGFTSAGFQSMELRGLLFSEDFDEVGNLTQLLFQVAGAYDLKPYFTDGALGVMGDSGCTTSPWRSGASSWKSTSVIHITPLKKASLKRSTQNARSP